MGQPQHHVQTGPGSALAVQSEIHADWLCGRERRRFKRFVQKVLVPGLHAQ